MHVLKQSNRFLKKSKQLCSRRLVARINAFTKNVSSSIESNKLLRSMHFPNNVSNSFQGSQLLRPIYLLKIKRCVIPLGATDSLTQWLTDATSVFTTHHMKPLSMQHTLCESWLHFLRCLTKVEAYGLSRKPWVIRSTRHSNVAICKASSC